MLANLAAINNRVLKQSEAAEFLSLSKRKLQVLDAEGMGPKRTRLSERRVGYRLADLVEWLDARRETT